MITFYATIACFGCMTGWILWRELEWYKKKFNLAQFKERCLFLENELGQVKKEADQLRQLNLTMQDHLKDQMSLMTATRKDMESSFQTLAEKAFLGSQQHFLNSLQPVLSQFQDHTAGRLREQTTAMEALVNPLCQGLQDIQHHIHTLEKSRVGAYESLREHIFQLAEGQKNLHQETNALTTALRAPHVRGCWGEMQLKRVVELAGMVAYCDFQEQVSLKDGGPTHLGKKAGVKPDMIIQLPGKKSIIVDAKAPLMYYLEALSAKNTMEYGQKMKEHAKNLSAHIKALSDKRYWSYLPGSMEFTVLFLPGEAFLSAALEEDPHLLELAADRDIILGTPIILIALLKTIASGWRQEMVSQHTQYLIALSKELNQKLATLYDHMKSLGRSLKTSSTSFDQAFKMLNDHLLPSVAQFSQGPLESKDIEIPEISPFIEANASSL